MYDVLWYLMVVYIILGVICWNLVIFLTRRDCSFSFALKSGFLLSFFWPYFLYKAINRTFRVKPVEK